MIDTSNEINHQVIVILLKKIVELLGKEEKSPDSISVDNLDEIRAALRNELPSVVRAIKELPDNKDIIQELKRLSEQIKKIELSPSINVEAAQVNIPDINIPDIVVPTPQVTVNIPDVVVPDINIPPSVVNLPAPIVNIPEVDLSSIIKSLELNLNKLRTNSVGRPLAVRLSDGQEWIKELRSLNDKQGQIMQFMSDDNYIKNASGQRINPATDESLSPPSSITNGNATVTTAGTRVQLLSSTNCRYVIITANVNNTGTIWVGGNTVAAGTGHPLVALQYIKIDINDVSKIYIDSTVNSEGVSFIYVN